MTETCIRVENVSFHYDPRRPVLSGVTFDLRRGEVLRICGPNGTGKTTLLRILAQNLTPQSGTVLRRGRTAFVPTDLWFHEALTVREEASYLCTAGTIARSAMGAALIKWGFDDGRIAMEIRDLSSGWRARLALAVADASGPQLLLLDEPFANLDRRGRQLVSDLVSRVAARGSVVLVDHGGDLEVQGDCTVSEYEFEREAS